MRSTRAVLRRRAVRALHLGRRDVVVLTDRYPPDSHGGAEVSLHIVLKALAMGPSLLVVTLGDRAVLPSRYQIDGVDVVVLPRGGPTPMHGLPHALTLVASRLPSSMAATAVEGLKRCARILPTRADDADVTLLRELQGVKPRGGLIADAVEFVDNYPISSLQELFDETRPRILHCDNYRSIMLAATASTGMTMRRIGVVRDHRFSCTRHDQSRTIEGKRCQSCDFRCAAIDVVNHASLQERALRRASAERTRALGLMDKVIVTSAYLRESLKDVIAAERVMTIPNAPDDETMVNQAMLGVAQLPGTNVLVVGMLNENKGQLDIVRALGALVQEVPDIVLHFAGRGDRTANAMRDEARRQNLEDRLVFHGYVGRENLYVLYAECQIVALPTRWPEPFGRVPLEAAMARRPVVSFAVGGLRESIVHEQTGILVPPNDIARFIKEIAALARSPKRRLELGANARQHVLATYSVSAMKERFTAVWREFLDESISV